MAVFTRRKVFVARCTWVKKTTNNQRKKATPQSLPNKCGASKPPPPQQHATVSTYISSNETCPTISNTRNAIPFFWNFSCFVHNFSFSMRCLVYGRKSHSHGNLCRDDFFYILTVCQTICNKFYHIPNNIATRCFCFPTLLQRVSSIIYLLICCVDLLFVLNLVRKTARPICSLNYC